MLGQYKLLEPIGEGGLAVVYKAFQPSLKRWVAVKVLYVDREEILVRFQREAETVARLRHPNILVVYEYGEEQELSYIAMELAPHGTLKDRLRGQPLEWYDVLKLITPIAEALQYAHKQGLIHRDVKSSNILMAQEEWPLLADFSLVKLTNADQTITSDGVILGTPAYIAPEQANGERVDPRADIYSLGVVMFEMITGRLPFTYDNPNMLMLAHILEPVPAPSEINPACPPELEKIILTALQKSAKDRYPDMQTMIEAMKHIIGSSTLIPGEMHGSFGAPNRSLSDKPNRIPIPRSGQLQPIEILSKVDRIVLVDKNITIELPEPSVEGLVIGRTHGLNRADIDLGPYNAVDAGVSRRHARLIRGETGWLIEDLGSLNGTYVNEVRLTMGMFAALKSGDTIRCSHLSFVFWAGEA
jgi:serine/threonine protein kinase